MAMKIPPEIVTPYLTEITSKPQADNKKAEPIGKSATLGDTISYSASEQSPHLNRGHSEIAEKKRQPQGNSGEHAPDNERRKENRRKETRPILLDTRSSRNRRESGRYATINFKI
jgi:hypothetical protein